MNEGELRRETRPSRPRTTLDFLTVSRIHEGGKKPKNKGQKMRPPPKGRAQKPLMGAHTRREKGTPKAVHIAALRTNPETPAFSQTRVTKLKNAVGVFFVVGVGFFWVVLLFGSSHSIPPLPMQGGVLDIAQGGEQFLVRSIAGMKTKSSNGGPNKRKHR